MYLTTASGRAIDIQRITPDDISILDIAHSLSNLCRFAGHTREFYSVAQHSVRVALALPPELRLAGLLHDATEAYVVDLPRPVKCLLPDYKRIEANVWEAISFRFGIARFEHPLIKEMDDRALRTEWEELMRQPLPMEFKGLPRLRAEAPLQPKDAYNLFLLTFAQLSDIKLPRLEAPR